MTAPEWAGQVWRSLKAENTPRYCNCQGWFYAGHVIAQTWVPSQSCSLQFHCFSKLPLTLLGQPPTGLALKRSKPSLGPGTPKSNSKPWSGFLIAPQLPNEACLQCPTSFSTSLSCSLTPASQTLWCRPGILEVQGWRTLVIASWWVDFQQ